MAFVFTRSTRKKKKVIAWKMMEKSVSACSSNKRVKELAIDRLSDLPDCLLISILSLLSREEAVRTCVLSKRWLFLWTGLPELEFEDNSFEKEEQAEFVARVHKTLAVCGGNHVKRFEVSFFYSKCFASDVNAWVQFALKHKVKNVSLLLVVGDVEDMYMLPQMMYSNSSLTRLRLEGCSVAPRKAIKWQYLSKLCLEKMELHESVLENILSGCPVLYDLNLMRIWGFNCLDVKSKGLRNLTLVFWGWNVYDYDYDYDDDDDDDDDNESFLEISAPFIHYLKVKIYVGSRKLRLTNISSLVRASIDCDRYDTKATNAMPKLIGYTKELFKKLHHVKKLEVGYNLIQALSDMVLKEHMPLPQSEREYLTIIDFGDENLTHGIVCLLKSSPKLKTLSLGMAHIVYQVSLEKADLNCNLLHLKTVKIYIRKSSYLVAEPMLTTLVQLLLKRAPSLEKMVIEFNLSLSDYSSSDYIKLSQTLLSYPRASTKAAVLLAPVKFSR